MALTGSEHTTAMFLDTRDFPFTELLESRWQEIRREFERLAREQLSAWPERDLYEGGWDVFGLWAMGRQLVDNCNACPLTAQAVETIPGMTTAGFSVLAPAARIRPHVGYTNSVLRCHLGIVVPDACGLQVGEEIRHWQEGKCFVFDDTVRHSAWNESDSTRIVLLIDFLRPGHDFDSTVSAEVDALIRGQTGRSEHPPT